MKHERIPADVDPETARLLLLADELAQTAENIAKRAAPADNPARSHITQRNVSALLKARRARDKFFPAELFADPAWDMLLSLFEAEILQRRISVTALCGAAAVPPTTALRWIKTLNDAGLITRREDPHDARRFFIELSRTTSASMRSYFETTSDLRRAIGGES